MFLDRNVRAACIAALLRLRRCSRAHRVRTNNGPHGVYCPSFCHGHLHKRWQASREPLVTSTMILSIVPVLSAFLSLGLAATVPSELFSDLVPSKILATTKLLPSPLTYPQYTSTSGSWLLFSPDTWTSGFFPSTLYALNTRKTLCGATSANGLGAADWLDLGRYLSSGEISLEGGNSEGHDQGFLSFPFVEELAM